MDKTVTLSAQQWTIIHNILSHHAPDRCCWSDERVYDEYYEARNSISKQVWG